MSGSFPDSYTVTPCPDGGFIVGITDFRQNMHSRPVFAGDLDGVLRYLGRTLLKIQEELEAARAREPELPIVRLRTPGDPSF